MRGRAEFRDRRDAGEQLAERVAYLAPEHPIVLALPRGGVPVAAAVARRLRAPLDVLVVRKLGVPTHPELAMGAIGEEGARVLDPSTIRYANVDIDQVADVEAKERAELARRVVRYRGTSEPLSLSGRVVVIVDDGIATGSTALAAVQVARHRGAAGIVLAVPVISAASARELARHVDELVYVIAPADFAAVGQFYADFSQTSDDEVASVLRAAVRAAGSAAPSAVEETVQVVIDDVQLDGRLTIPEGARGIVLFAHGSGSSAQSPRNRFVADALHDRAVATLLFDLLTPGEADDRRNVFDIGLLGRRLAAATRWVTARHPGLPVGYFGASTGGAAAILAAADPSLTIDAVVSRGGRVDLAGDALRAVRAPTLLIVGGNDEPVLGLNRAAAERLRCEHEVVVVPGASHLFEEPGALEVVAGLAAAWFADHLGSDRSAVRGANHG
jgi:putative phosphoribosyl transferase